MFFDNFNVIFNLLLICAFYYLSSLKGLQIIYKYYFKLDVDIRVGKFEVISSIKQYYIDLLLSKTITNVLKMIFIAINTCVLYFSAECHSSPRVGVADDSVVLRVTRIHSVLHDVRVHYDRISYIFGIFGGHLVFW